MSNKRDNQKAPKAPKAQRGRPRYDWATKFIEALSQTANVRHAAAQAGIDRCTAYRRRNDDPEFLTRWDTALQEAADLLELELFRRAVKGVKVTKGVYHAGRKIAEETVTNYSDTLLIFLMKAVRPEKFRETIRQEVSGPAGGPLPVQIYLPANGRDDK